MYWKIKSSLATLVLFSLPMLTLAGEVENTQLKQQNGDEILAFIGEKIFVKNFPLTPEEIADQKTKDEQILKEQGIQRIHFQLNIRLKAKYKILKVVSGDFKNEEIEFFTQDHFGIPRFSKQDPVLLYLTKINGSYFHVRYPYSYVYPTSDNTWASCGTGTEFPSEDMEEQLRQVHAVKFSPALRYDISEFKSDPEKLQKKFPASYFKIFDDTADCLQGITVNELVAIQPKEVSKAK